MIVTHGGAGTTHEMVSLKGRVTLKVGDISVSIDFTRHSIVLSAPDGVPVQLLADDAEEADHVRAK